MEFRVSVIIPAYNAEKYISKSVQSALAQKEVCEIIVVEDGSTDDTLNSLKALAGEEPRLVIFRHENGENKGRAASRNFGLNKASEEFIAFLDADDYYLPDRFKNDIEVFKQNPDADGVYNAIGAHFYSKPSKQQFDKLKLTSINKKCKPDELFYEMWPKGFSGAFSGDGLTVKRDIFKKTGNFNENLEVAEDTELWIKMSLKSKLYPGILGSPVSIRGVHEYNVIHSIGEDIYLKNYYKMYKSLLIWGKENSVPLDALDYFWERLHQHHRILNKNEGIIDAIYFWWKIGLKVPALFQTKRFLKAFPLYYRP